MINIDKMVADKKEDPEVKKLDSFSISMRRTVARLIGTYVNRIGSYTITYNDNKGILFANSGVLHLDEDGEHDFYKTFVQVLKYDTDGNFFPAEDGLPSNAEIEEWKNIFAQAQHDKDSKMFKNESIKMEKMQEMEQMHQMQKLQQLGWVSSNSLQREEKRRQQIAKLSEYYKFSKKDVI